MKKHRKVLQWLIPVVFVLVCLVLSAVNLFVQTLPRFWETSISQILSTFAVLAVSYWLVQQKLDNRKEDDALAKVLERTEKVFFDYSGCSQKMIDVLQQTEFDAGLLNSTRQIMLSAKQKLDGHMEIMKSFNSHKEFSDEFEQLAKSVKAYNDAIDSLPITNVVKVEPAAVNEVIRWKNIVETKFIQLYAKIYK